jgi:hypothetical protein
MAISKVTQQSVGYDGQMAGTYGNNPMNNTMVYEVESHMGKSEKYAANIIAENMLTQVSSEGYLLTLMDAIVDYNRTKQG